MNREPHSIRYQTRLMAGVYAMCIVAASVYSAGCLSRTSGRSKVDPVSQAFLARLETQEKAAADFLVPVILETTQETGCLELTRCGFLPAACSGRFASGRVRFGDISRLERCRTVKNIRSSGTPTKVAPPVRAKTIIAVVDQGFRLDDEQLWDGRECQALSYWDQRAKSGHRPSVLPQGYGNELVKNDIEALYQKVRDYSSSKEATHGLWMAEVAAGGSFCRAEGENCTSAGRAPSILVDYDGSERGLFDALVYIAAKARELGARCVVSLPYSTHFGPHDGTDLVVRSLDRILEENVNVLLVVSAGNEGHKKTYAETCLTDGATQLPFKCSASGGPWNFTLEGWYSASSDVVLRLTGQGEAGASVPRGRVRGWKAGLSSILVDHRLENRESKKRGFRIQVVVGDRSTKAGNDEMWRLQLGLRNRRASVVRLWVTAAHGCSVAFEKAGPSSGVSALASSRFAISVGAYSLGPDSNAIHMNSYSSRGTDWHGIAKPDVLAPGKFLCGAADGGRPGVELGTSGAAAYAAKVVADVWESFPELSSTELRGLLRKAVLWRSDQNVAVDASGYRLLPACCGSSASGCVPSARLRVVAHAPGR